MRALCDEGDIPVTKGVEDESNFEVGQVLLLEFGRASRRMDGGERTGLSADRKGH